MFSRSSSNLLVVERKLDNQARSRIAAAWRPSGLSQAEYAKAVGVSTRAIRQWSARFPCGDERPERADDAITEALNTLQAGLADIERAVDAARAAAAACMVVLEAALPLGPAASGVTEAVKLTTAPTASERTADAIGAADGGAGGTEHRPASEPADSMPTAGTATASGADQSRGASTATAEPDAPAVVEGRGSAQDC
jgi:DNA-binding transcriptional regulator YiaG